MDDINSLSHSKWRCKYHIVFAPKYRRRVIYKEIRVDIGKNLRKLCEQKHVEIIEAELCPDHVVVLILEIEQDLSPPEEILPVSDFCLKFQKSKTKLIKKT